MSLGSIIRETPKKILRFILRLAKSPLSLFRRLKPHRSGSVSAEKSPSRLKASCVNFLSKTGHILNRAVRVFCFILGVGILGFGLFVGALFYFVDSDSVKSSFIDIAHKSLGAKAIISGPIQIQRLPRLTISLPQIQLLKEEDNSLLASIDAISTEVSLWSLPLGATRLQNTEINGLKMAFYLEDWIGEQAFKAKAEEITFPRDLRIREIAFTNTEIDLFQSHELANPITRLKNIEAHFGEISPELDTSLRINLNYSDGSQDEPSPVSGSLSLETELDFSSSAKTLTLRNFKGSGSLTESNSEHILMASANRLRFKPTEVTGLNIQVALSAPDRSKGEFTIGLADFLADATRLATPELKLVFQKTTDTSQAKFDFATGANVDLSTRAIRLTDITGSFTAKGLDGIPDGLAATVKGEASGTLPDALTNLTLAGNIGKSSFTYNGSLEWVHAPSFKGNLSITSLAVETMPGLTNPSWLHSVDFDGEVRIGQLQSKSVVADQFQANISLTDGIFQTKNAIANVGNGRVEAIASLKDSGDWTLESHFDSVPFENLFAVSPLTGKTNGTFTLSGKGNNLSTVSGSGKLRLLRGELLGIDISQLPKKPTSTEAGTSKTTFDELTSDLTVSDGLISLKNFVIRNAASRIDADIRINLTDEAISGAANILQTINVSAPKRNKALFSGPWFSPVWTIEQKEATSGKELDSQESSLTKKLQIWKNLKDFFKF